MIFVNMTTAKEAYFHRTGKTITYEEIAEKIEMAESTVTAIGSHDPPNTTLRTVERICRVLGTTPAELLVFDPSLPEPAFAKSKSKKKTKKKAKSKSKPKAKPAKKKSAKKATSKKATKKTTKKTGNGRRKKS